VISLVAGIVVLASPFESIGTLALVTGIWLIVIGVMEVITAFGIRSAGRKLAPATPATPAEPPAEPPAPAVAAPTS
jgi:hypothetical protein